MTYLRDVGFSYINMNMKQEKQRRHICAASFWVLRFKK